MGVAARPVDRYPASVRHRPELDGLRGIAILLVLFEHAGVPGFATGGTTGVTLFFVLSGYLITSLLLIEIEASGRIDLIAFYMRRALRLLPALYAVLLVVAVFLLLGLWPKEALTGTNYAVVFVSVIFYAANWVWIAGNYLNLLGHTWSLAVEEQFYIIWPVTLFVGLKLGRRRLALVLILVGLAVTPWREYLVIHGDVAHAMAGLDTHADALLLGCAVALVVPKYSAIVGWLGVVGVLLLATAWQFEPNRVFGQLMFVPLVTVAGTVAVAACPAALGWRPLAFIGKISYGLYLWHGIIIWYHAPWPITVAVSLVVAVLSWYVIERPFLALKGRFARTASGRAAAQRLAAGVPSLEAVPPGA